MYPFFYDPTFLLLIPAMIFAGWARWKVKSTYRKFEQVPSRSGRSGAMVAANILATNHIDEVPVEAVPGTLSDHYDPRTRTVRLSEQNYRSDSIAAVSIAAHEVGHAMQHSFGYAALAVRHGIFPVVNIASTLAFPLFLAGFIFQWPYLIDLGIVFFAVAVLFHVVTLPVEFNASSRALAQLRDGSYLEPDELEGARKVLTAAALTYVAATAVALTQLLRLLILRGRNN